MAITLTTTFEKFAAQNEVKEVYLVHLYYDATHYKAFATYPTLISTVQYLACLQDTGTSSIQWKIMDDNGVTKSNPTVSLNEYSTPDGYSLQEEFATYQFTGKRVQIYMGYEGNALSDYIKEFDGLVDEIAFKDLTIELACRSKEIPDIEIGGRQIHAKEKTIGTTDISATGILIPEVADKNYLPVVLGNHWNAPVICYDVQASGESSWSTFDKAWWSALSTASGGLKSFYRNNINQSSKRILLPQDDFLVPIFPNSLNAGGASAQTLFQDGTDSRISSMLRIKITDPASCNFVLYGDTLKVECPMRLRYDSTAALVNAGGASSGSIDADGNLVNIFDGDGSTSWGFTTHYVSTGSSYKRVYCYVDLHRNLRTDDLNTQHQGRPIHIPNVATDLANEVLFLAHFLVTTLTNMSSFQYRAYIDIIASIINPTLTAGHTLLNYQLVTANTISSYKYLSQIFERNLPSGYHILDFSSDVPNTTTGFAEAGNSTVTDQEAVLAFLGRDALEKVLKLEVRLTSSVSGSPSNGDMRIVFYDLFYDAFSNLDNPKSDPIYTDLTGATLTDGTDILSCPTGQTAVAYQVRKPPQYVESILRAKTGAVDADFNAEWSTVDDKWNDFYENSERDYSGFVIKDNLTLKNFLQEYVKDEPFTCYIDTNGLWRFVMLRKTIANIQAEETIHVIDFNDCDAFEMEMTPQEKLIAEIKSCETDFVYFNEGYAEKRQWKLDDADYDYTYWNKDNSESANRFYIETLQKKYTSSPVCGRVASGGVYYGALRTSKNQTPSSTSQFWGLLAGDDSTAWGGTPSAYSSGTLYQGCDAENREVGKFKLNQFANRHKLVKISTPKPAYRKHEIGDTVEFQNVPYTLLGLSIKGFSGNEDDETIGLNNQDVYYTFTIVDIKKRLGKTEIIAIQSHDLTAYEPLSNGVQSIG